MGQAGGARGNRPLERTAAHHSPQRVRLLVEQLQQRLPFLVVERAVAALVRLGERLHQRLVVQIWDRLDGHLAEFTAKTGQSLG